MIRRVERGFIVSNLLLTQTCLYFKIRVLLVIYLTFSWNVLSQELPDEYFEGQIFYDIEYKDVKGYSSDQLELVLGSRMIYTFKEGNTKKEYFSRDGKLLSTRYLDLNESRSCAVYSGIDTIPWFDISENGTEIDFEITGDTVIKEYECKELTTVSVTNSNEKIFELYVKWYYANSLPINPNWYDDYYEGRFNEIMDLVPQIPIEWEVTRDLWKENVKFSKIIYRKVKKNEVSFDPGKRPMKKL